MSSPSPTASPLDISGLSISAQLDRSHDGYDHAYFTAPSPYTMMNNAQQSFDGPYNNTVATMGPKPGRGGLPTHWLDQQTTTAMSDNRSTSPPTDISSSGSPPPSHYLGAPNLMPAQSGNALGTSEEDIIPTAIVIKNIPFSVKRETLLDIIASLSIPTPYAFNYHLDAAGAFRGLAFANFRLPADADAVVAALNGFDVQGRKLRVEYKKVLQAGEKERIEREKAIRRMRSMQLEKEKERMVGGGGTEWDDYGVVQHQQQFTPNHGMPNSPLGNGGIGMGHPSGDSGIQTSPVRSYSSGPMTPHQYPSAGLPQIPPVPQVPQQYYSPQRPQLAQAPQLQLTASPPMQQNLPNVGEDHFGRGIRSFSPPSHTSASPPLQSTAPSKSTTELDLNDPSTLEIYSRILVFKEDRMRDELAFSRSLSPKQRRVVHLVAQKLGVYHYSVGEGEDRYAIVTRIERENRASPVRHASHTLSRAQSSYLTPTSAVSGSLTHSSLTSMLRAKKSMPDLASLHAPSPRLSSRSSNGNIREGYATISSPGRRTNPGFNGLFNGNSTGNSTSGGGSGMPPVPTLPPMPNILVDPSTTGVVRQPRGPGVGGFSARRPSDIARFGSANIGGNNSNGGGGGGSANNGGLDTRSHEPLEI